MKDFHPKAVKTMRMNLVGKFTKLKQDQGQFEILNSCKGDMTCNLGFREKIRNTHS